MALVDGHLATGDADGPPARVWLPGALAAITGALVVGLLLLLWFGLRVRDQGTVGIANVPFRTAPDFELGLFDGGTFRLSDTLATGKPVVMNFWASWCIPCRDEAPVLEAGWQQFGRDVQFVGVNVQDAESDARAFIAKYGATYPNGQGNSAAISVSYGMRGVPETYFISPDARVVRKWNGPLTAAGLNQFVAELRRASGPVAH